MPGGQIVVLEGEALKVGPTLSIHPAIVRWCRSLFYGIPFNYHPTGVSFSLRPINDPTIAYEVTILGDLASGRMDDRNRVKVTARHMRSGTYQFLSGFNVTKHAQMTTHGSWSALTVRIVTVLLLMAAPLLFGVALSLVVILLGLSMFTGMLRRF